MPETQLEPAGIAGAVLTCAMAVLGVALSAGISTGLVRLDAAGAPAPIPKFNGCPS